MRFPKPFFRQQTQSWYVEFGGKQYNLGKDKAAAQEKYHELATKLRGGLPDDSIAVLLNRYLAFCENNQAHTSFVKKRLHLRRLGQFLGPKMKVSALKPHHLQTWLDRDYKGKSDTYRNDAATTAKSAFSWAAKQGYIGSSPVAALEKPRPNVREFFVPSEQWPQLVEAAGGEAFKDYIRFALSTGARPQEIRVLEAKHFDRPRQRFVLTITESKGRRRQRTIYLDATALEITERLVNEYPEGPIFRDSQGDPWGKDSIRLRFRRLRKKVKMPGLVATTLRHSWAHHKLATGTDSLIVSKLLGHVDGRMLATRYGHVDQNEVLMLREATRTSNPLAALPAATDGPTSPA